MNMEPPAAASKASGKEQSASGPGVPGPADSAMDGYLRSQGLYRKRVAKDGSCLFRAVAEQVFHSQSQHLDIRMACINYLRKHREQFEAFIEGPFEDYLKSLQNPQEWVGQVEISALSLMYKKDFIIYREPNAAPSHVTENGFPDKVLLCFSNGSHYDIVYPIEYTFNAAYCQSILYELLYEKVFKIDVSKILEDFHTPEKAKDGSGNSEASESEDEEAESEVASTSCANGLKPPTGKELHKHGRTNSINLPRKVLKSLNPFIYQNVEYEVWQQSKRDQQKQDFSIAAGMQYSVGDKCKVRLDNSERFYNGHIQEVQSANGPVVVFVEELGSKHSVLLKNLKPLPQTPPLEIWSTVPGKKIKKPTSMHGQNIQTDADGRGSKHPNKPVKTSSALPPRLQGMRQHHPQQMSPEHRISGRSTPQTARKTDRDRTENVDCTNAKDSNYFGISLEEQKEKQAVEEVHSLYEVQVRDEEAFPVLSVATQTIDNSAWKKHAVPNGRRSNSLKEEKEEIKDLEARKDKERDAGQIVFSQKPEQNTSENEGEEIRDTRGSPPSRHGDAQSPFLEQRLREDLSGVDSTPPSTFSEMHLPATVPSVPAIVPAWPSEATAYGSTGVPPQIPVSAVMPTPPTGLDATLSQASPSPVAGIPVSLQAVNQPLMPMPQTMNPYQDPLYPGFPLNEKGERVITPPYSLCSAGEDLPSDKNILRFFFNLGVKAYSCPMWAPHSYLYPLHQACLTAYRMYPKVPVAVYSHNPWMQEVPLTQNGNEAAQIDGHFPVQNEVRVNGQSPQTDSMSPSVPLFIPPAQVPDSQGLVCVESENPVQTEYDEPLGGKSMFPQSSFGQHQFLGPVPVAPLFPPLWYGYPVQGYVENSVIRQVVVPPEDKRADVGLPVECSSSVQVTGCPDTLQKARGESRVQGLPLPATTAKSEFSITKKTSARVPREKQMSPATLSSAQVKPVLPNTSMEVQDCRRPVVSTPKTELKSVTPSQKERTDKISAPSSVSAGQKESRGQKSKEESSEDECEVSDILKSGRSKQFYNQTYGSGRRPRSEWNCPSGRGGYQYPRNEESWKALPNRHRDDGYQYHRSFRGRLYRNERRRANMGDAHRGQPLS